MPSEQYVKSPPSPRVIVAAVIIVGGRVLACQRRSPPEAAGKWEFPGGKVERGETDEAALARECREELGITVEVGARVGPDVPLAHGRAVLRVFAAEVLDGGVPEALEHADLRWLTVDELGSVPWLPADVPIVAELPALMD
ncbi:pyrophosphohydrolase MutT [Actinoplanes sp. SE50]|uniref:(deoxy)nucleoside triphosphate pyrophosphohydrolase n=1 Tax=unclassified Actinoplanes TaxID=2626549 RepID=UPI00023EDCF1|nr:MULTISPECIES: (deoxy)nucleoside triphosphate pyrophosphohydrolase [unclassified Actinoplanes]AEV88554.1 NUDIX hydrolase [Actinoplanes sp. SE50/110]ATO86959.1 pyrophosphohydrolase MutT [Actinoplanes sp. SE50]SLM04377.1 DNA mismatch repair protein MutT [Actinoplanes sp. SE50/110]